MFVRGGSVNPAHTQGENITQGHEYQEVGISRSWLLHLSLTTLQPYNCISALQPLHALNKEK